MKKTFRLIVVAQFIGLFCLINQATTYAKGLGTTGAQFLKVGMGARPLAMAGAFSAVSDDVNSIYYMPIELAPNKVCFHNLYMLRVSDQKVDIPKNVD